MYTKNLSTSKLNLLEPIITKLENNSQLVVTNPDSTVLESIRQALYAWQAQNAPGKYKIKRLRQDSKTKALQITNRAFVLAQTVISVTENKLTPAEEVAIELSNFSTQENVIEILHEEYNHLNKGTFFLDVITAWKTLQGNPENLERRTE